MVDKKNQKSLHIGLWIAQVSLAVVFVATGFMKIIFSIEKLAESNMTFVNTFSVEMVRFIGISELFGAVGLVIPAALRIKPTLTPLAAIGIAIIMVMASGFHISHSEPFVPTLVLLTLAIFVAWGRLKKVPIKPK